MPGSSGRTCSCPAASSSTSRILWPATWSRQRLARASRPGGMLLGGDPGGQQQAGQRVRRGPPAAGPACARAAEGRTARPGTSRPAGARRAPRKWSCRSPPSRRSRRFPPARRPRRPGQRSQQPRQFGLPAGEAADITRQVTASRPRWAPRWPRRAGRPAPPRPAPGRGPPRRTPPAPPAQAERVGQQPGAVLAGRPVDAPLQVTDRARAQPGRLGQFLLGQPGLGAQLPQQLSEPQLRRLPHRPTLARGSDPRQRPAPPTGFRAKGARRRLD